MDGERNEITFANFKKYIQASPFLHSPFHPFAQPSLNRGVPIPVLDEDIQSHLKCGSRQEGHYPSREKQEVNVPEYLCW